MEFTFQGPIGKPLPAVTAKTAKQAAQLVAFQLWKQNGHPALTSHTQIDVSVPESEGGENEEGGYGVTFTAPGETRGYTFATSLRLIF